MAEQPALSFAGLLRQLRGEARLTQEELAEGAGLSPRSISDLERGVNLTARKDTAVLLADALGMTGPVRELFVAAARGRAGAAEVLAARETATGPVPGVSGPRGAAGIAGVAADPAGAVAVIRTLPRDTASFTGRAAELAHLLSAAAGAAAGGGVVGIHAIGGMAGIGKTTFAVHAAHRLAGSFPDGQFFVPLHAHTPGQRPVGPADALASLLLTAGVGAQQIPPGVEARAGLWRDRLAGKKVLLLLDDAASHEQVTPLLPGTAGSLVLVTSRRHLTALADAATISLDTLSPGEAAALLARLSGRPELNTTTGPAGQITRLCGYLPLAIGMLARQLHHHPSWTGQGLAGDLAATAGRLELMRAENLSVAAAFDLSYADLTAGQQALFRRLGLHPGPAIDGYAAAALHGASLAAARRDLEGLYDHYLLTEPARGRYGMHDLLREHAAALAAAGDAADADAAAGRLFDYYAHTAASAASAASQMESRTLAPVRPPPGRPPVCAPALTTTGQAAAWLDAERPNLHAIAGHAAAGQPAHAIAIAAAISGFLFARGHWDQAVALHQAALSAACQAGDRAGQAAALNELGLLQRESGDYQAATASHLQALGIYRDLGDQRGQASALDQLGMVQRETGDSFAAAASHQQAIELYSGLGHRLGQAVAVRNLGVAQIRTGDYPAAAASMKRALSIFRELGDRAGQASAINSLGVVHLHTGDYYDAAASYQQSLTIARTIGDRHAETAALHNLGHAQRLTGDYPAATATQRQALVMYRDLGHPLGQAMVLNELGHLSTLTGDYQAAADHHHQVLVICRDLGHREGEATVLNDLGELLARSPASRQARDHYTQALAIARDIGDPLEVARALEGIGRYNLQDANPVEGIAHLQQALAIYQQIGAPYAQRVRETLSDQGNTPAPRPAASGVGDRQLGAPAE